MVEMALWDQALRDFDRKHGLTIEALEKGQRVPTEDVKAATATLSIKMDVFLAELDATNMYGALLVEVRRVLLNIILLLIQTTRKIRTEEGNPEPLRSLVRNVLTKIAEFLEKSIDNFDYSVCTRAMNICSDDHVRFGNVIIELILANEMPGIFSIWIQRCTLRFILRTFQDTSLEKHALAPIILNAVHNYATMPMGHNVFVTLRSYVDLLTMQLDVLTLAPAYADLVWTSGLQAMESLCRACTKEKDTDGNVKVELFACALEMLCDMSTTCCEARRDQIAVQVECIAEWSKTEIDALALRLTFFSRLGKMSARMQTDDQLCNRDMGRLCDTMMNIHGTMKSVRDNYLKLAKEHQDISKRVESIRHLIKHDKNTLATFKKQQAKLKSVHCQTEKTKTADSSVATESNVHAHQQQISALETLCMDQRNKHEQELDHMRQWASKKIQSIQQEYEIRIERLEKELQEQKDMKQAFNWAEDADNMEARKILSHIFPHLLRVADLLEI